MVFSQNHWSNWYFGNYAGLHFSPNPTVVSGGQTTQLEGSASISDNNGNLLFYTDGRYVWDRSHNFMPNAAFDPLGAPLGGGWSTSQSALIVPMPGDKDRYYLFTLTPWNESGDLTVSIVNMTLNNGFGDVETTGKNRLVATRQTEKLVSATASGCGVWVITHQRGTNVFESRLVTAAGIAPPVYSAVGSVHSELADGYLRGVMKVSHDNRNIALATAGDIIELFRFNAASGIVSDPIPISTTMRGYGVCFSADDSKLYVTEGIENVAGFDISQFDLSNYTAVAINGSKTFIGRATVPQPYINGGDLQVAPDGKIYFAKSETYYLGCIPSPNLSAPLCGFIDNGLYLGGNRGLFGLPNEVRYTDSVKTMDMGGDTALCSGETLLLQAPASPSYTWSTGGTTDRISINETGSYWVKISDGVCFASDTVDVSFNSPTVFIGNDTTLCADKNLVLSAGSANAYSWSTGETTSQIEVSSSGQYSVEITKDGCKGFDTIVVTVNNPSINIGPDTTICDKGVFVLDAGNQPLDYTWQDGSKGNSLSVKTTGLYILAASDGVCTIKDSAQVNFNNKPAFNLGEDIEFCTGDVVIVGNDLSNIYSYVWEDGSTSPIRTVNRTGTFTLTASNECGSFTDEMVIIPGECVLAVPNAFTPNGDGKNDVFRLSKTTPLESFNIQVFNRWGQKVFESRDQSQGWNGMTGNKNCDPGNYPYVIQYRKIDGTVAVLKGVLLLIR
jgi:gliding motility-associated-like protein